MSENSLRNEKENHSKISTTLSSSSSDQLVTCRYVGGKSLGITFEWINELNHLIVSEDSKNISNNLEIQTEESFQSHSHSLTQPIDHLNSSTLLKGDILVYVNEKDVSRLSFEEIVKLLKAIESDDRSLTFRRLLHQPEEPIVEDDDESSVNTTNMNLPMNSSTIHQKIHQILFSSELLKPVHCQVTNLSYWYESRQYLSSKKQLSYIIQQNPHSMRYDSSYYVMKVDEEGDGEYKPMKRFISSHSTRWGAYLAIEKKMKERDSNPYLSERYQGVEVSPDKILSTHYRVLVVSDLFYGYDIYDRLLLVYRELLSQLGKSYAPEYAAIDSPLLPSQMKHFSYLGDQCRCLPLFQFLETNSSHLSLQIEPLTPSQWRPSLYRPQHSECFGSDHLSLRSLQLNPAVLPKYQRKRLKLLTTTEKETVQKTLTQISFQTQPLLSRSLSRSKSRSRILTPSQSFSASSPQPSPGKDRSLSSATTTTLPNTELLGVSSTILNELFHKKKGGVYGHFFSDLSPSIQSLVLERYVDNKKLIQKEGGRMRDKNRKRGNISSNPSHTPVTTMSIMKAKLENSKHMSDYDVGTGNVEEMVEEILLLCKKIERVALRIQRIFRQKLLRCTQCLYWKEEYSALQIQRIVRGKFGRLYFALLQKIVPLAIHRIITTYRQYMTRKRMKAWFALVARATQVIAPILKRFVKKLVNRWLKKHTSAAIVIQSLIRRHLAIVKYWKLIGQNWFANQLLPAVVLVQSIYRGYKCREKSKKLIESYLQEVIDTPAAILIQRIFRGLSGRRIYARKLLENNCAIIIQKYILRWHEQVRYIRLKQVLLERFCAITIQRVYRGRLDRKVASYHHHEKWYQDTYLPTVVYVQSIVRRFLAQRYFQQHKKQYFASLTIQLGYRCYKARQIYERKLWEYSLKQKERHLVKIQSVVRQFLARRQFRYRLYAVVGKRMIASKVIIRAWKAFTMRRRYEVLLREHRRKVQKKKIEKLSSLREEILKDLEEISVDLTSAQQLEQKASNRITVLEHFLVESEMRMNDLERELLVVEAEDISAGWGESYTVELDMLAHQQRHSSEELRLRRRQFNQLKEESFDLFLELEDTQLELDHISVCEVEAYEYLRQSEREEIEEKVRRIREREVRMERCKWKVQSSRRKVIRRNRGYFDGIREKIESTRDMSYSTTVSHEKRAQRRDEEEIRIRREERETYRNLTKHVYRYENYAGPVQDTYDDVIANSLSLLRNMSLDERVHRMQDDVRTQKKVERKKRGGGLTFALKSTYQEPLTAFEKLNGNSA